MKTWFDQPARKQRRRKRRIEKAKREFPRPASGLLRPLVRSQTARYNKKLREGKGFTFEELRRAGIPPKYARTIGIAVDHRRRNKCEESLQLNTERLQAYRSRLVVFPRKKGKPKAGDSSPQELQNASQVKGPLMPSQPDSEKGKLEMVQLTPEQRAARAYAQIRLERANQRWAGRRQKRREKEEQEERDKAALGAK